MIELIAILIVLVIIVFIFMAGTKHKNYRSIQEELALKMDGRHILTPSEKEAVMQAEIVGDLNAASAISTGSYNGPLPEKRDDGGWLSIYDNLRILKIAGINYREGIGRYVGRVNCALVPEPDNEFDPDAIKIVAEDRHHLGYVPSGQTELVCWLTANEFPYKCTAVIELHEDEDDCHQFFTGYIYIKRLD